MNRIPVSETFPAYLRRMPAGSKPSAGNRVPANRGFRRAAARCSSVSGPMCFCTMYSWSTSDSPGKSGWPSMSSPMMHPMAH